MADSDSTVRTNIEVNLTKDDSAKAAEGIRALNAEVKKSIDIDKEIKNVLNQHTQPIIPNPEEQAEKIKAPQRELRILAHQLGQDIPGASELMRAGFVGSTEPMLAAIFLIIGALEIIKTGQKQWTDAIGQGIEAANEANSANEKFGNTVKDLIADAAQEAAIHLRHLNSEYDSIAHNLTISLAAINNHADATRHAAQATDELAEAQIRLHEAQGLISPADADAQIARRKLAAQIAEQNAENAKDEAEAQAKFGAASQDEFKARGQQVKAEQTGAQSIDIGTQIAGIDKQIALKGALGNHADLEKKAVELEAIANQLADISAIKNPLEKIAAKAAFVAAHPGLTAQIDLPGGAQKFSNDVSIARANADNSDTSGLEEHKKQLERQKKDIDDLHDAAVKEHDALVAHAKALWDEAKSIQEKTAARNAGNVASNTVRSQTIMTDDATRSIDELHRLESEGPSRQRTEALNRLLTHMREQAQLDIQDRAAIQQAIQEIRLRQPGRY